MQRLKFSFSIPFLIILFSISCQEKEEVILPPTYNYSNVPDGGTVVINNADLSNQGTIVNRSNTTWILQGNIHLSDLSVVGKVIVDKGAVVSVNGLVNVAGGAKLEVRGNLQCSTLTQVGDIYYNHGNTIVNGQYTIGGGTSTYLLNSKITVNDLKISGSIYGLQNDAATNGNYYSVFYFPTANTLYLNRAAGNKVCGPVLFTYNDDKGTSGANLSDVSSIVISQKPNLKINYNLPSFSTLYQYQEQGCTDVAIAKGF